MAAAMEFAELGSESWVSACDEAPVALRSRPHLRASDSGDLPPSWPGANAALLSRLLDELDYGLMVVTDKAQVRLANREARRECDSLRCLKLHDGQVQPRRESERQAFFKALAASCLGRRTMLTFGPSEAPLSLAVVPVCDPLEVGHSQATLLVFGRRQVCEPLSVAFFAREHRLTTAEGVVLQGLCDGLCPAEIGRQTGVAVSTVRSHVASIRLKTGSRSIGELVRRVTVLPPIVSVLC